MAKEGVRISGSQQNRSGFGEIIDLDVHPCMISEDQRPGRFPFAFGGEQTLNCLLEIDTPELRIHALPTSSNIVERCRVSTTPRSSHSPSEIVAIPIEASNGSRVRVGKERSWRGNAARFPESQPVRLSLDSPQSTPAPQATSGSSFFQTLKPSRDRLPQKGANLSINGETRLAAEAPSKQRPVSAVFSSLKSSSGCSHYETSPLAFSASAVPALIFSTALNLSFCGENITFDLKDLERDSRPIIELLSMTGSDCGLWMMVGAYYRRSGNVRAAMSVIDAMINVMVEQGLSENDLKPAFLLLSSCEADLAKRVRITEPNTANEHLRASQSLLQRVYGTPNMAVAADSRPKITMKTPYVPLQFRGQNPMPLLHGEFTRTASVATSREKILQREVQSLVDARNEQTMLLSSMKRKFEGEIAYERDGRRRLTREIEDLEKEVSNARRMESFALSQVKREVDARRKAEESVRVERAMRLELQRVLQRRPTVSRSELEASALLNSLRGNAEDASQS